MAIGGVLIWLVVIGLAVYAIYYPGQHDIKKTRLIVIGGGAAFPTVVLTALLTYGLSILPDLQRPAPEGSQVIEVVGVRWWWRVRYRLPDGETVETANEIHLPVDEATEFKLTSEDVIHSFWIPSIGGKTDMIPGRENRLKLFPTRVGTYRGVCTSSAVPRTLKCRSMWSCNPERISTNGSLIKFAKPLMNHHWGNRFCCVTGAVPVTRFEAPRPTVWSDLI